ncbi:hypothetical protein TrRE_jg9442 [Triparma retinervis]|uniref:Uncharacterized protein n=1 Tax=Triparma retinervis TaxID=2557542 RepID=A0A9W7DYS8_9STRA|nr:hypothetical protein TrRE_jg9442 [Triparma retinervis]
MVPLSLLTKCSKMAADKFEDDGGHSGTYLDKPWKNSRIYIDAKQLWTKEDSDFMDPIIECVRQQLMDLFDLPDSPTTLPVEAAFVNYYVGNGNQPRDMESGDILGTLDCQPSTSTPATQVSLRAGDALVLAEGYHKPHPVEMDEKRLVFVIFFAALEAHK